MLDNLIGAPLEEYLLRYFPALDVCVLSSPVSALHLPLQNLRISLDRSPKSIYVTHDKKRPFNVYIEESL